MYLQGGNVRQVEKTNKKVGGTRGEVRRTPEGMGQSGRRYLAADPRVLFRRTRMMLE